MLLCALQNVPKCAWAVEFFCSLTNRRVSPKEFLLTKIIVRSRLEAVAIKISVQIVHLF